MTEIKRIDIKEFRELGFLQEANRQFFHPLGLALEIVMNDETGECRLGGVWDYRDDPEGVCFGSLDEADERAKATNVREERMKHFSTRLDLFGSTADCDYPHILEGPDIEPLGWAYPG